MERIEVSRDQILLGSSASKFFRIAVVVAVVGILGTIVGYATGGEHAKEVFFEAYLLNFMYVLSIGLGALFFVIIMHLTRAGWSVGIRRLAEIVSSILGPVALLSLGVVAGMHELYEWTHADAVAHDKLLQGKEPYLNQPFFYVRLVVYFLIWIGLAQYFSARSRKQDETGDPKLTVSMERVAAPGVIAYALTVTLAAIDFMMSLTPHWYSTIYGVYYFAGCVIGFFALVPLLIMLIQRAGKLKGIVTLEHYHDLGKLLFAFTVFWAYIAFSQYMLIWAANIPEETMYYEARQTGFWAGWSVLLIVGHFFVPFLVIMSRYQKRRMAVLAATAIWMLAMHWVDLYWVIIPGVRGPEVPFALVDFTLFLAMMGIVAAVVFWRLGRANLIPVKDPRLPEALSFENA